MLRAGRAAPPRATAGCWKSVARGARHRCRGPLSPMRHRAGVCRPERAPGSLMAKERTIPPRCDTPPGTRLRAFGDIGFRDPHPPPAGADHRIRYGGLRPTAAHPPGHSVADAFIRQDRWHGWRGGWMGIGILTHCPRKRTAGSAKLDGLAPMPRRAPPLQAPASGRWENFSRLDGPRRMPRRPPSPRPPPVARCAARWEGLFYRVAVFLAASCSIGARRTAACRADAEAAVREGGLCAFVAPGSNREDQTRRPCNSQPLSP